MVRSNIYLTIYISFMLIISGISEESLDEKDDEKFVPTDEWQEVQEGQQIPPGLHIRINLKTGIKEAKLMSAEENGTNDKQQLSTVPGSKPLTSENVETKEAYEKKRKKQLRESVINALKKMKSDEAKSSGNTEKTKKFRSYEQLKADFEALKLNIETDSQIIRRLVKEYKNTEEGVQISIIDDLAYLVHQLDNGVNFVEMNGIDIIVKPGLNASNSFIRKSVLQLIGSASQSNPKVQIAFLEEGILSYLLRLVATEKDAAISSKAVHAISCIVRGFPYGQKRLVDNGGLDTLRGVFRSHDWKLLSVQLKVVSLIQDLLTEHETAIGERKDQLSEIDLIGSLKSSNWCSAVSGLLESASFDRRSKRLDLGAALSEEVPLRPDHDTVDKVTGAMNALIDICREEFKEIIPILKSLEATYNDLAYKEKYQGESGHYFFSELAQNINKLLKNLREKDEL